MNGLTYLICIAYITVVCASYLFYVFLQVKYGRATAAQRKWSRTIPSSFLVLSMYVAVFAFMRDEGKAAIYVLVSRIFINSVMLYVLYRVSASLADPMNETRVRSKGKRENPEPPPGEHE